MGEYAERLIESLLGAPDVHEAPSRYGDGDALFIGRREIVYAYGDDRAAVRLTARAMREHRDLLRDARVVDTSTDWVWLTVASQTDLDFAVALATIAVAANRPY